MNVSTFMLCDAINNVNSPQGTVVSQLISPRTVLRPQFIPSAFSFGISIGIEGVDLHKNNKISFKILDPDGNLLQASEDNELPATKNEDTLPTEYQGYVLSIDIRNLIIKKSGLYVFSLSLNGEEICSKNIPIYEAKNEHN